MIKLDKDVEERLDQISKDLEVVARAILDFAMYGSMVIVYYEDLERIANVPPRV